MDRILVALLAIAALFALVWPKIHYMNLSQEQKLDRMIEHDLAKLARSQHLPKSWGQIRSIEVLSEEGIEDNWLSQVKAPMKLAALGDRHLEMQVLPWFVDGRAGATVNYVLIDPKSKNTVWEFGRTFEFEH